MFLGGISGSGPANAAAVGAVMITAMSRAGYPAAFSASVVGAAAATDGFAGVRINHQLDVHVEGFELTK